MVSRKDKIVSVIARLMRSKFPKIATRELINKVNNHCNDIQVGHCRNSSVSLFLDNKLVRYNRFIGDEAQLKIAQQLANYHKAKSFPLNPACVTTDEFNICTESSTNRNHQGEQLFRNTDDPLETRLEIFAKEDSLQHKSKQKESK